MNSLKSNLSCIVPFTTEVVEKATWFTKKKKNSKNNNSQNSLFCFIYSLNQEKHTYDFKKLPQI